MPVLWLAPFLSGLSLQILVWLTDPLLQVCWELTSMGHDLTTLRNPATLSPPPQERVVLLPVFPPSPVTF